MGRESLGSSVAHAWHMLGSGQYRASNLALAAELIIRMPANLEIAPALIREGNSIKYRGFLPELDGLRAIAIMLVFLHHFWPHQYLESAGGALARMGWVGVDLFFVLSGFLIAGILLDSRESPTYFRYFYIRRTLRIFPLYY